MSPPSLAPLPVAVVLYDGDCAFCRRSMRFVEQRDRHGRFNFVALQSEAGHALLRTHQLPVDRLDSIVLVEDGRVSLRSSAILRICRHLSGAWPLLYAGIVLPRRLCDWLYDAVAKRRNR